MGKEELSAKAEMPDIVSGDYLMVLRAAVVQHFDSFFDTAVNAVGIEPVLCQQ